jgi:hypothetical protein
MLHQARGSWLRADAFLGALHIHGSGITADLDNSLTSVFHGTSLDDMRLSAVQRLSHTA